MKLAIKYSAGGSRRKKSGSERSPMHRKGVPWTEAEHRLFLLGLEEYGRGAWRTISKEFVTTRTATQVASHAQKYYLRQSLGSRRQKKRPSIHDISTPTAGLEDWDPSTRDELKDVMVTANERARTTELPACGRGHAKGGRKAASPSPSTSPPPSPPASPDASDESGDLEDSTGAPEEGPGDRAAARHKRASLRSLCRDSKSRRMAEDCARGSDGDQPMAHGSDHSSSGADVTLPSGRANHGVTDAGHARLEQCYGRESGRPSDCAQSGRAEALAWTANCEQALRSGAEPPHTSFYTRSSPAHVKMDPECAFDGAAAQAALARVTDDSSARSLTWLRDDSAFIQSSHWPPPGFHSPSSARFGRASGDASSREFKFSGSNGYDEREGEERSMRVLGAGLEDFHALGTDYLKNSLSSSGDLLPNRRLSLPSARPGPLQGPGVRRTVTNGRREYDAYMSWPGRGAPTGAPPPSRAGSRAQMGDDEYGLEGDTPLVYPESESDVHTALAAAAARRGGPLDRDALRRLAYKGRPSNMTDRGMTDRGGQRSAREEYELKRHRSTSDVRSGGRGPAAEQQWETGSWTPIQILEPLDDPGSARSEMLTTGPAAHSELTHRAFKSCFVRAAAGDSPTPSQLMLSTDSTPRGHTPPHLPGGRGPGGSCSRVLNFNSAAADDFQAQQHSPINSNLSILSQRSSLERCYASARGDGDSYAASRGNGGSGGGGGDHSTAMWPQWSASPRFVSYEGGLPHASSMRSHDSMSTANVAERGGWAGEECEDMDCSVNGVVRQAAESGVTSADFLVPDTLAEFLGPPRDFGNSLW